MKKIAYLLNGRLKKKDELIGRLRQRLAGQVEQQVYITAATGDGIRLGQAAIEAGADFLIAVGGDGMLNELVNGYMNRARSHRENAAIGLLPYGTANDFAKTIGMRKDVEQLAQLIENTRTRRVDVGEIRYQSDEGEAKTRYFINIADLGIGGQVARTVNRGNRLWGANLTYRKAIIQAFFTYKHIKVRLTSDTYQWQGPILSLCMANGRFFGSGLCIAPQAEVADGQIQLVILGNVTLTDYLRNLSAIKRGDLLDHPEIHYQKVSSCRIESGDRECPVNMDGEFIGYAPIEMNVLPQTLKILQGY
ncbi:MAG: diacylglycerol/lipid kinase family protein [bacterium]